MVKNWSNLWEAFDFPNLWNENEDLDNIFDRLEDDKRGTDWRHIFV